MYSGQQAFIRVGLVTKRRHVEATRTPHTVKAPRDVGAACTRDATLRHMHLREDALATVPDALCVALVCPFVPLRDRVYSLAGVSRRWQRLAWLSIYDDQTLDLTWCAGEHELDAFVEALVTRSQLNESRHVSNQNEESVDLVPPSKLEAFRLYGPRVTAFVLSRLVAGITASRVRQIEIESKQVDDSSLRCLVVCAQLQYLALHCVKLTAHGLTELSRACTQLQRLDLSGCSRMCDEGVIAVAANCPKLNDINLFMCLRVSDRSLVALALRKHKTLHRVIVDRCLKISGLALRFLMKSQPSLRILSFANCPKVQNQDFMALEKQLSSTASRLEHVEMSGCASLSDSGAVSLVSRNAATLCSLHMRALLNLTSSTFTAIAQCTLLEDLNLSMCRTLQNGDLAKIVASCERLQTLKLQGCVQIDDDGTTAIATHAAQLRCLSLEFCYNVTDAGFLRIVAACHRLEDLNVKALNHLTVKAFDGLVTLKSARAPLRRINIGACADFDTTLRYASIIKRRYARARIEWT